MLKLIVEFTDGSVNEWLCQSQAEGNKMLTTMVNVKGHEYKPINGVMVEPVR
jgi:hypothetical protein